MKKSFTNNILVCNFHFFVKYLGVRVGGGGNCGLGGWGGFGGRSPALPP